MTDIINPLDAITPPVTKAAAPASRRKGSNFLADDLFAAVKGYIDKRHASLPLETHGARIDALRAQVALLEQENKRIWALILDHHKSWSTDVEQKVADKTALLSAQVGEIRARMGLDQK